MAATAIWKEFGLEEEYRRIVGNAITKGDVYNSGEGRRVVSATNVFATEPYKLPPGADAKLLELYPKLTELSRESCFISESNLKKMASDIRERKTHVSSLLPARQPPTEPFTLVSPTKRNMASGSRDSYSSDPLSYKRLQYVKNDNGFNYNVSSERRPHESADRVAPRAAYGIISNGNIFDGDSVRSRNFPKTAVTNRRLTTPSGAKDESFNFQEEFLSAFQPDLNGRHDYGMIETPVVDKGTRRNYVANGDTLVSPFPWEKNLEAQRSVGQRYTPKNRAAEASEHRYPSYISRGTPHIPTIPARRRLTRDDEPFHLFDSSKGPRDFSAKSPIRSIMRDSEHSYGYKNTKDTPVRLYQNLL